MSLDLKKAKELYEAVTSNPFWENYDMQHFEKVRRQIYSLQTELCRIYPWNSDIRKKNPTAVLFGCMNHDFNLMMSNLYWSTVEEDVEEFRKMSENKKFVLNNYILILRRLTFEESYEHNIGWLIDYSPYFRDYDIKHDKLAKFTVVENEDGTYRAVRVVKEEQRKLLRDWLKKQYEKFMKCHATSNILTWYRSEIDMIECGAKVTNSFKFE